MALLIASLGAVTVPVPQQFTQEQYAVFEPGPEMTLVLSGSVSRDAVRPIEETFARGGVSVSVVSEGGGKPQLDDAIHVGIAGEGGAFGDRSLSRYDEIAAGLPAEGYLLEVRKDAIILIGKDAAGVARGISRLAGATPRGMPCGQIRDWPTSARRYVLADRALTEDEVDALAATGCNGIVFATDAWADLGGASGDAWRRVFDTCRARGIEPIPVVDFLHNAGAYLRAHPAAVEARVHALELTLLDEDWASLGHRHLLPADTATLTVEASGRRMIEGQDFIVDRPALEYPYAEGAGAALLRRIEGGGIPNGAAVTVTYVYAPENSQSLCLFSPEAETAGRAVVAQLQSVLGPTTVHLGFGAYERFNRDPRTPASGASEARLLQEAVQRCASWYSDEGVSPRLLVWETMLADPRFAGGGAPVGVQGVEVVGTSPAAGALMTMPANASRAQLYAAARQAARAGGGMIVPLAAGEEAVSAALSALWNPDPPGLPWPKLLNAQFGADLWEPDDAQRLDALAEHTNRMMLQGQAPAQLAEAWGGVERQITRELPSAADEAARTGAVYQNLLDYLQAEARYARGEREPALKDLEAVVTKRGELDPDFAAERMQRILDTMRAQQLFAPASIVFGRTLRAARSGSGAPLFEIPATAEYDEDAGVTTVDLVLSPGSPAVARADFESAGASLLKLESAAPESRALWSSQRALPASGPALLATPAEGSRFVLRGEGPGDRVTIREVSLYGPLPARAARCVPVNAEPPLSKLSEREELGGRDRAYGLFDSAARRFAAAQTEVWFLRTPGQWFAYIRAHEPRMGTMVAGSPEPAPDAEREEVRIRVRNASGEYTFAAAPGGARYALEYNDPAWKPAWSAELLRQDDRWEVLIAVPFSVIGGAARAGEIWDIRIDRQRRNVLREDSTWEGTLRFD
jgi:hypothetical protein